MPPKDDDTAMTPATTNNFYMQSSQNGGIHGKSPLSKPVHGDLEDDESDAFSDVNESVAAGRREPEVYERTLQPWRAAIRRPIVRMVEKESHVIAALQVPSIFLPSCTIVGCAAQDSDDVRPRTELGRHGWTLTLCTPRVWEVTRSL